jgi:hypothetical protein
VASVARQAAIRRDNPDGVSDVSIPLDAQAGRAGAGDRPPRSYVDLEIPHSSPDRRRRDAEVCANLLDREPARDVQVAQLDRGIAARNDAAGAVRIDSR